MIRALRAGLAFAFAVLACGCRGEQSVGTRYLKKVPVVAAVGATIGVTASESAELAGTQIIVPPGALLADATLTLELGLDPLAAPPDLVAGPVLMLGPPEALLRSPLTVTLPLTGTVAPDPTGASDVELVVVNSSGGRGRVASPAVAADLGNRRVHAQLAVLVAMQPIRRRCASDAECAPGVCSSGRCQGPRCGAGQCQAGEVCCNDSCGACAKPGQGCPSTGACAPCSSTQQCPNGQDCLAQSCHPGGSVPCGNTICAPGATCCDPTCGLCSDATNGASCTTIGCGPPPCSADQNSCPPGLTCRNGVCLSTLVPCGQNLCADGMVCCNASCGQCTPPGNACSQLDCACSASNGCGPPPTLPPCPCSSGMQQCSTGQCVAGANGGCSWGIMTCM